MGLWIGFLTSNIANNFFNLWGIYKGTLNTGLIVFLGIEHVTTSNQLICTTAI